MFKAIRTAGSVLLLLASACVAQESAAARYVGAETCALCHKDIAMTQARTAMANTWQGRIPSWLPPSFVASAGSSNPQYSVTSKNQKLSYTAPLPEGKNLSLPIDVTMGGQRHGLGFLLRIENIDGLQLERPALVQARYAWSPENRKLLLAPGCAPDEPQDVESALGLVLSPTFEARCLACHGQPDRQGSGAHGGVRCESCHGPGSEHVRGIGLHSKAPAILNPKRLSPEAGMAVCAQCHVGLARFSDPSPDDLLIANQVRAIQTSECFLQSGKAFSCTSCHDPHSDSPAEARTVKTCLGCHSAVAARHSAICPVNSKTNCVNCHMPSVDKGPLHLVDHNIRVHPEQNVMPPQGAERVRTQVSPVSEYLRIIATNEPETARAAEQRLKRGDSFYDVARESSVDRTAAIGGYLGRVSLVDFEPVLREKAATLDYGETSSVIESGSRYVIMQRLPRDFRWDAEQQESQAEGLGAKGDSAGAIAKAQAALKIYPHFLRALNFIAAAYASNGNPKRASEVLRIAADIYPNDAGTQFALASAFALAKNQDAAIAAYKKVIALDNDFLPAYIGLGTASSQSGNWQAAAKIFRQGLEIDPMCAELNYDLGQALQHTGDADGAKHATALAATLDPRFSSVPSNNSARQSHSGWF